MAINIERSRDIYETRDYEQFVFEKGNRETDAAHVNNIVKSMQIHGNLMDLYPIVVQEAKKKNQTLFVIKDGQHRYEAALRLRISIYYTIDGEERLNLQTVIDANAAQKSWSLRDFLGSYCIREFEAYLRVREYVTLYPMALSEALQLLGGTSQNTWRTDFKRGHFKIRDWEWSCKVGDAVRDFAQYNAGAYLKQFVRAVQMLLRNPEYDHGDMLHKLEVAPFEVQRNSGTDEIFEALNRVYNYKRQAKNLIELRQIDSLGRTKKAGRWVAETVG